MEGVRYMTRMGYEEADGADWREKLGRCVPPSVSFLANLTLESTG
jgi:hypothetical protein